MLGNVDVQEAFIDWMKANTTIIGLHANFSLTYPEIREIDWQGEKFVYPNIRVGCEITPAECGPDECFARILVFSEEKSSKQAESFAGTIAKQLHKKNFSQSGVRFSSVIVQRQLRAAQESGVWRSELSVLMRVN